MKLARGAIPLYYQIAQILRSQIQAQEYKPKEMLPTEDGIIQTFGVSRTTVRQALQLLLNDGLIYRIAGKGTFVAERPQNWGEFAVGTVNEIIAASSGTKRHLLGRETVRANEDVARRLRVPVGTEVTEFRGLRTVDGEPFFYFIFHMPTDLAAMIPLEISEEETIMAHAERYCNFQVQEARQWTAATLAGSELAQHLKLRLGDPVLLVERQYIDTNDRVVGVTIDRYRTDRVRHFLRLTRATPSKVSEPSH